MLNGETFKGLKKLGTRVFNPRQAEAEHNASLVEGHLNFLKTLGVTMHSIETNTMLGLTTVIWLEVAKGNLGNVIEHLEQSGVKISDSQVQMSDDAMRLGIEVIHSWDRDLPNDHEAEFQLTESIITLAWMVNMPQELAEKYHEMEKNLKRPGN